MTVGELIARLKGLPPEARAYAYEGEVTAVVVTHEGKQLAVIPAPERSRTLADIKPAILSGVGDGWLPIVNDLIAKLDERFPGWTLSQVKEKFGGLRFYADPPQGTAWEDMELLIADAEVKAAETCEWCGQPGRLREGGWLLTLCDECQAKREDKRRTRWHRERG